MIVNESPQHKTIEEGKESKNQITGPIPLCLDQSARNYLYLYNTSKDTYQQIEYTNMTELKLTTGGKYLLAEKRLSRFTINKMVYAGGMLCCIVIGAVYVRMKKKYWSW